MSPQFVELLRKIDNSGVHSGKHTSLPRVSRGLDCSVVCRLTAVLGDWQPVKVTRKSDEGRIKVG